MTQPTDPPTAFPDEPQEMTQEEAAVETFNPIFLAVGKLTKGKTNEPHTVQQLFQAFLELSPDDQIQAVNAYLLAKVMTSSKLGATITAEFLKEMGRNLRALLNAEKGSIGDDNLPWD